VQIPPVGGPPRRSADKMTEPPPVVRKKKLQVASSTRNKPVVQLYVLSNGFTISGLVSVDPRCRAKSPRVEPECRAPGVPAAGIMFFAVNGESRRSSDAEITRPRATAVREDQRPPRRRNLTSKVRRRCAATEISKTPKVCRRSRLLLGCCLLSSSRVCL
jgi:hypothetical protein